MLTKNEARVTLEGAALDVRKFRVEEHMNQPFAIDVEALCPDDLDLERLVGEKAIFELGFNQLLAPTARKWQGTAISIAHVKQEATGLSRYHLRIEADVALLGYRKNMRAFQYLSELDIVEQLLGEWKIAFRSEVDRGVYKKRKFKVQYAESDLDFVHRLLEELGVSYFFETDDQGDSCMVLHDAPHTRAARFPALLNAGSAAEMLYDQDTAVDIRTARAVRPTKYTIRDHDYRKASDYWLGATEEAPEARGRLAKLERFQYVPGAFLFEATGMVDSPSADGRGASRSDEAAGKRMAKRRLEAQRSPAERFELRTNAVDIAVGTVIAVLDYSRLEGSGILATDVTIEGNHDETWLADISGTRAKVPYRPALVTKRPHAIGVESATVVGPAGEEVHCDEFGRVKVHFHWDRESGRDENSSCWVHVNQNWAGTTFGSSSLPRIGQEVLVEFLGGDPDRPIITGRVYTNLQKKPYGLPANLDTTVVARSQTLAGEGFNEISMKDTAGAELLFMKAQMDHVSNVGNNKTTSIVQHYAKSIGSNQTTKVGKNQSLSVGGSQSISIGGNQSTIINGSQTVAVGKEKHDVIKDKYTITVGKSKIEITPEKISIVSPEIVLHATEKANDIKGKPIYLNCTSAVQATATSPSTTAPAGTGTGTGTGGP